MNKEEYAKLVKKYTPSEEKLKHALIAFLVGGIIGILACFIYNILLKFNINAKVKPINNIICSDILIEAIKSW